MRGVSTPAKNALYVNIYQRFFFEREIRSACEPQFENVEYRLSPDYKKEVWEIRGTAYDKNARNDDNSDNARIGTYHFIINVRDKSAHFEKLAVEPAYRDQKFAKEVLASFVTLCKKHGITRIETEAVEDGVLAWTRYGFTPTQPQMSKIQGQLRQRFEAFTGSPWPENEELPKYGHQILNCVVRYDPEKYPDRKPEDAKIGIRTLETYQRDKVPYRNRADDGFKAVLDLQDQRIIKYLREDKRMLGVQFDRKLGTLTPKPPEHKQERRAEVPARSSAPRNEHDVPRMVPQMTTPENVENRIREPGRERENPLTTEAGNDPESGILCVVKRPGEAPEIVRCKDGRDMRALVGFLVDSRSFNRERSQEILVNDNFVAENLAPNVIHPTYSRYYELCGTVVVKGNDPDGNDRSLTQKEARQVCERLRELAVERVPQMTAEEISKQLKAMPERMSSWPGNTLLNYNLMSTTDVLCGIDPETKVGVPGGDLRKLLGNEDATRRVLAEVRELIPKLAVKAYDPSPENVVSVPASIDSVKRKVLISERFKSLNQGNEAGQDRNAEIAKRFVSAGRMERTTAYEAFSKEPPPQPPASEGPKMGF
jgi:GNAT superfamily N-acetyltransferase